MLICIFIYSHICLGIGSSTLHNAPFEASLTIVPGHSPRPVPRCVFGACSAIQPFLRHITQQKQVYLGP